MKGAQKCRLNDLFFCFSKIEERSSIVDDNDADRSEEDERSQAESSEQVIFSCPLINEEIVV
jgi:hypothetical protein